MKNLMEIIRQLYGDDGAGAEIRALSGGDINEAYLALLKDGRRIFLKRNVESNRSFFKTEEHGLAAIRKTGAIRVPEVYACISSGGKAYLVMEYLEAVPRKGDFWERFGRQLAAMHRADAREWTPGGRYGFYEDNFIGAGAQRNTVQDSFLDFFRTYRLEAQFQQARHYFDASLRRSMQSLLDHLEEYLAEPECPSLLHGDLWGGNFVTGPDGCAWLIDPAVYVGHAEADLAMTELFGGFSPRFYAAYREANPGLPGYSDRRDIYNLYHLLNHLNLFGSSYCGAVMRIIRRYSRV